MKLCEETKGKVVLFYPVLWWGQFPMWAPLGSFAIASALMHAGYEVVLIDERIDAQPMDALREEIRDALFVGVCGKSGGQCIRMEEVARFVKECEPQRTVVAGGWFPGLFPDQTITSQAIDIVIAGPADHAVVSVADALREGKSLRGIEKVFFKEADGSIYKNEIGHMPRLDQLPAIPWHEVGIGRYLHPHGWLNYFSSRGCPGGCTFCSVYCIDPRRWSALPPERVLEDMEVLTREIGARALHIMDTDFCANLDRVEKICRGILDRGLELRFNILGRHYTIRRMSDEQIRLLRRAGCNELEVGLETGSQRLSDQINKQCDVREFEHTVRRFTDAGIRVRINIMVGLPNETRADMRETFRIMLRLRKLGLNAIRFQMFRFTPIPDAPAGREVIALTRRGHQGREELSYEELLAFPMNDQVTDMFWLEEAHERDVMRATDFYGALMFYKFALPDRGRRPLWRLMLRLFRVTATWRLASGYYHFPFEMWLNRLFGSAMPRGADEGISSEEEQLPIPPLMGESPNLVPADPLPAGVRRSDRATAEAPAAQLSQRP